MPTVLPAAIYAITAIKRPQVAQSAAWTGHSEIEQNTKPLYSTFLQARKRAPEPVIAGKLATEGIPEKPFAQNDHHSPSLAVIVTEKHYCAT